MRGRTEIDLHTNAPTESKYHAELEVDSMLCFMSKKGPELHLPFRQCMIAMKLSRVSDTGKRLHLVWQDTKLNGKIQIIQIYS